MTRLTFQRVEAVTKWTSIAFAWCAWISAAYISSIALFIAGFVPYLLIYNWIVRGVLQSKLLSSEEPDRGGSAATHKE